MCSNRFLLIKFSVLFKVFILSVSLLEVVKYLLEKGADIYHEDKEGHTVIHHAEIYKQDNIIDFLKKYQKDVKILDKVYNGGSLESVTVSIPKGAGVKIVEV